ncbi:TraI conjugal transfer protein [Candidatus Glomeribacter gigasporarum BEG34]|uniref:TraI conjugal transfer protein n=1 Tax=Candidatus Glomeribacter gigasporarum BEG34 TaxID=1070319 RepID=G2J827_9BURK|nr:TraI conjugal transfer protein [Candidatus Glomeribacter gigasporarum BEG34]
MRFKKRNTLAFVLGCTACIGATAHDGSPAVSRSLEALTQLSAPSATRAPKLSSARASLLSETAQLLGSHLGLAERSAQLIAALEARADKLDMIYRFPALVSPRGVLPPVITEARDAVQVTGDQLRVADRIYRMVARARFVTTPPSWRDDLFVGLRTKPSKERPTAAALPRTPDERAYWTQQVRMGYTHGRQLADQILERNRARLDRTFLGMLRYTALLKRGLVVEPTVSAAPAIVTGDATHLNIGDTLYRITDPGGLILDARRWRPVVAPASSSGTKP